MYNLGYYEIFCLLSVFCSCGFISRIMEQWGGKEKTSKSTHRGI